MNKTQLTPRLVTINVRSLTPFTSTPPLLLTSELLTTQVAVTKATDEAAMDVVVAKIIALLVLTVLTVLCGLLPLRLFIHLPHLFTRGRNSIDHFLGGLRLFSGGT